MTLLVSGWDFPDFYIYRGFEVKKLLEMLIQYPLLKSLQPILQEGNGEGGEVSAQKKENIKYLPVSVGIYDGLSQHVLVCKLAKKMRMIAF